MSELTPDELEVAGKMGISPEEYSKSKRPTSILTPEALAFGAYEVARALGVSYDDFIKHGKIVVKDGE